MFGCILRSLAVATLSAFALCAQAQDIVIGQIGPFTGLPSPDAHEIRDGARAYFDQVNQSGGLRGRKLSLFTLDDTFKGDVFLERFKEAMAKRPVALISPIGSAAMTKLLKEGALDAADIVIVNAIPGSEAFRNPGHPKLFHIRAGDKAQLDRILLHCKTLGIVRLHVVYQDLPIGEAGLGVVKATAQAMGGMTIDATLSKHSDEALQAAAKAAAALTPQGVIVIGSPKFMADAVSQLRKAGVKQAAFALSYLPTPLAVKVIGEEGARGLGITQTFPNPNGQNMQLQRDFKVAMTKAMPDLKSYSPFHFEGYITARVLVAALRRVEANPTPAALGKALHDMGELDLGGFRVSFAKDNIGSTWTDIGVVSPNGKLMY